MRKFILLTVVLFSLTVLNTRNSSASPGSPESPVICLPGIYLVDPQDCLPTGPSAYLTGLAKQGITLPVRALPAEAPDPGLAQSPYLYARLQENLPVPVYASLEDAIANASPVTTIAPGKLRFISYIDAAYVEGRSKPDYFMLKSGGWVAARDVAQRENATIRFQGLTFHEQPPHAFGWIVPLNPTAETKRTPGYEHKDYTGHVLSEYAVVQIYSSQKVGDVEWYLVGPDEWLEQRLVGKVTPNPTPPDGVTDGRWIEVNLFEQTLAVYDQNRLVYATLIATGAKPFYTRPGLFKIYKKLDSTPMQGAFEADRSDFYYLEDVPWTMYFDQARALHGAYWRTRFGFPQSHGCVNLSPGDAHWLFNWAQEGDWVYVWDPSGNTPTDASDYTEGGA